MRARRFPWRRIGGARRIEGEAVTVVENWASALLFWKRLFTSNLGAFGVDDEPDVDGAVDDEEADDVEGAVDDDADVAAEGGVPVENEVVRA